MNSIKTINSIRPDKIRDYIGKNVFVAGPYYGKVCKIIGVLDNGTCVYEDWNSTPRDEIDNRITRLYPISEISMIMAEI